MLRTANARVNNPAAKKQMGFALTIPKDGLAERESGERCKRDNDRQTVASTWMEHRRSDKNTEEDRDQGNEGTATP